MKEPNIAARLVTRKTINRIGIGIGDVREFAEVRVAMFVLDEGVSMPMRYLDSFQPLQEQE